MYEIKDFQYLFQREMENAGEFRFKHDCNHRVKTIKSGDVLEVEIFRVFATAAAAKRQKKCEITSEEQKKVNQRNAKKKFERMINTNFGTEDLHTSLTYNGAVSIKQARTDMQNFVRRVKTLRKSLGLPPMKYAYVIESNDGEALPGKPKGMKAHHHIVMSGLGEHSVMLIQALWNFGYINTDPLQKDGEGNVDFEALAEYVMKDPKGKKRWSCSKNMDKPVFSQADKKLSKRKIEKIITSAQDAGREIFEKFHPGYKLSSIKVHRSDWIEGVYIYVKMHKTEPDNRTPSAHAHTRTRAQQYQIRKGAQKNGTGNG